MTQLDLVHGDIAAAELDTLVVNLFAGVTQPGGATGAVDKALDGAISAMIAAGDLTGKLGEVRLLYPFQRIPAHRIIVTGLGEQGDLDMYAVREASAQAIRLAHEVGARHVGTVIHGSGIGGLEPAAAAQATAVGALLGLYRYRPKRRDAETPHEVDRVSLVELDPGKLPAVAEALRVAQAIANGVGLTRTLVLHPPNVATPSYMADVAAAIGEAYEISVTAGGRSWAAERNMGGFLAVAQGARRKPRFIIIDTAPDSDERPIVLIGKGITFDTGGISLKDPQPMWTMKADMAGAAAVLGAVRTIAELQLPQRVVAIAPCTENKPDANAYMPSEVITISDGTTVEIMSTDAEGRMVLADALVYARRYNPLAVIDLATLTGSATTAMGDGVGAPFYCNDDGLAADLSAAGFRTHERLWRMPLWPDYRKFIKSEAADIRNSGLRPGGLGASAAFLHTFVDYPWAHLDIAGVAFTERTHAYETPGATGFGVRLLVDYLRHHNNHHNG